MLIFLSSVDGVATRIASFDIPTTLFGPSWALNEHNENAQKFNVLTGRVYRSHGFGLGVVPSSAGKTVEKLGSSDARSCHILRLLSRP
jgi:hypothetical protein